MSTNGVLLTIATDAGNGLFGRNLAPQSRQEIIKLAFLPLNVQPAYYG